MLRRYRDDLVRIRPSARRFFVGSALLGAAHAVPWTLLALFLDERGFTKEEIGFVQSADAFGKVIIAIPAALVLARRPARPIFAWSALVAGAAYAVLPWVGGLVATCACNLVAGTALSVHYVAIAPFLFRHTGPEERATAFGLAEATRTLAAVFGAFFSGQFAEQLGSWLGGTRGYAWGITAGGLVALFGVFAYSRIRDETPSMEPGQSILPVLRRHRGILLRFALPQFFVAAGAGFCIPFLPLYFKERFLFTPGDWGTLFASGQILMTTGFLLTPIVLSRLGFVRSMVVIELLSIPFFLVLAFTHSVTLAVVAFLLRGALMNSTHPILKNFMMQATPGGAREMQTGINATLWGIGWVVAPTLAGRVLDATGDDYGILMCTTVGCYLVAAVLSWTLLAPIDPTRARRDAPARPGGVPVP